MTVTPRTSPQPKYLRLRFAAPAVAFVFALGVAAAIVHSPGLLTTRAYAAKPEKELTDYALIAGTVWNANGTPAYGIPVIITRADGFKGYWKRISDHHGEFAARVPTEPADYILRADIKVPKGSKQPEARVHINGTEHTAIERVDVGLHLDK